VLRREVEAQDSSEQGRPFVRVRRCKGGSSVWRMTDTQPVDECVVCLAQDPPVHTAAVMTSGEQPLCKEHALGAGHDPAPV
jgi:hypothetical protein